MDDLRLKKFDYAARFLDSQAIKDRIKYLEDWQIQTNDRLQILGDVLNDAAITGDPERFGPKLAEKRGLLADMDAASNELRSLRGVRTLVSKNRRWNTDLIEFIHEDFFQHYAVACGDVPAGWPYDYIDWKQAADALKLVHKKISIAGEYFYYKISDA